jgi:hypothetical protein
VLRRPLEFTQYLSIRYTERLAEAGIATSVGSKGHSYDNALAESVIGLFKTEVIRRRGPWRNFEDVEFATLEWIWWFNNHRLLGPIGHVPPAEFEEQYYRSVVTPQSTGSLNANTLRRTRRGSNSLARRICQLLDPTLTTLIREPDSRCGKLRVFRDELSVNLGGHHGSNQRRARAQPRGLTPRGDA